MVVIPSPLPLNVSESSLEIVCLDYASKARRRLFCEAALERRTLRIEPTTTDLVRQVRAELAGEAGCRPNSSEMMSESLRYKHCRRA